MTDEQTKTDDVKDEPATSDQADGASQEAPAAGDDTKDDATTE